MKEFDYKKLNEDDFDNMVVYGPNNLEIHGRFTNCRIDRTTLPDNTFAYDIREAESGLGTIEKSPVTVDFGGTFVCETKIEFKDTDYIDILSDNSDWGYSFK